METDESSTNKVLLATGIDAHNIYIIIILLCTAYAVKYNH